jgi:AcrR family transcriptional regulator
MQEGRAALRGAVLEAASRLLLEAGPPALTMRRIASEIGASTTVLYTMFGGKDGIADALYRDGFARLRQRIDDVPADRRPLERLAAASAAYRAAALADPAAYRLMFGLALPGFVPSAEAQAEARGALDGMVRIVEACILSGDFRPVDARFAVDVLLAAAHGAMSLELARDEAAEWARERYRLATTGAAFAFLAAGPPRTG